MKLNQTSGTLFQMDEQTTEVAEENKPLHPDQRKIKLGELLVSLSGKLDQLARINSRLFQMTTSPEEKELNLDDPGNSKFLQMTPTQDGLIEPVLAYRLSWLLDFLKESYGFEDGGVFLFGDGKDGLEKLVISTGSSEKFEDEVEAFWSKGDIFPAVGQKKRIILPAEKEGIFLIIPFKILDKKDGFWMAHFKQDILSEKKKSADLLFWVELFASLIENSYLKKSSFFPQKKKSYHIETEKLFTTAELSQAVVHEINNSLQIILGRTQLLKMNEKKSPDRSSNINILETIEENANRICTVLKDFSDHLHRQFDETTDAGEVNIQHILESDLALVKYILKKDRIQLEPKIDDDLPTVYGSPGELELAFLSLIWGVREHLSSGGSIRLQPSTEEESLCLNIYCAGKDDQPDGYPNFTDLELNDRLKLVSQILEKYHGGLKFEKLVEREMRFSLRFPMVTERKTNREELHELKL